MTNRTRTLEYSGAPFGRPGDPFTFPEGHFAAVAAGTATLLGQDSVTAADMSGGLSVYCYYAAGTFANGTAVKSDFPGKTYLGITPYVAGGISCLDVEPGDAVPADCPAFVAGWLAVPGEAGKPTIYTSAGDLQAVIDALASAGHARDTYYLFSAHWTGLHICGPSTCGYPQADATQYASNASYDSDVFTATIFGAAPVPTFPLVQGDTDGAGATTGIIHDLQINLNKWHGYLLPWPAGGLAVDGDFGPLTAAAVNLARAYFHNGAPAGECDQALYNDLAGPLPVPPPPAIPAPAGLAVKSVLSTGSDVTLAWDAVAGQTVYDVQLEYYKDGFGWVLDVSPTVTGLSTVQSLAPRLKWRWRAAGSGAGHDWSAWVEFTTL